MLREESKQVVTCSEMKELEKAADGAGLSYYQMMENAGMCSATIVMGAETALLTGGKAVILCGKGNNGGDGLVVARILSRYGTEVKVILVEGDPVTPDAAKNFELLKELHVDIVHMSEEVPTVRELDEADIIVDAVYGTGFHGEMRPKAAALTDAVNGSSTKVVSLDIPSGLAGDDESPNAADGKHINADYTVTFHSFKPIHKNEAAREAMGKISVADIGIHDVLK